MAKMLWPTITREQFWFGKEGQPDCLVGMPFDLPDAQREKWADEALMAEGEEIPHFKAILPQEAVYHVAWGRNDAHYHGRSVSTTSEASEVSETGLMEKLSRLMQAQQEEENKLEKEADEWLTLYESDGAMNQEKEC